MQHLDDKINYNKEKRPMAAITEMSVYGQTTKQQNLENKNRKKKKFEYFNYKLGRLYLQNPRDG